MISRPAPDRPKLPSSVAFAIVRPGGRWDYADACRFSPAGIGEKTARGMIESRPYASVEDLQRAQSI